MNNCKLIRKSTGIVHDSGMQDRLMEVIIESRDPQEWLLILPDGTQCEYVWDGGHAFRETGKPKPITGTELDPPSEWTISVNGMAYMGESDETEAADYGGEGWHVSNHYRVNLLEFSGDTSPKVIEGHRNLKSHIDKIVTEFRRKGLGLYSLEVREYPRELYADQYATSEGRDWHIAQGLK